MSRGSLTILACTLGLGLLPAALPGAALASAAGPGAGHRAPSPAPHRGVPPVRAPRLPAPRSERVSLLYVLNAGSGTLTPTPGAAGRYTLSLHGLDRHSVWFSDRPARRSGAFPSSGFAAAWSGFGFAADPPNAALVYTDPASGRERTVILELTNPTYRQGHALTFNASLVDPSKAGEDLSAHARNADREPASRLGDPSLFVDDTSAPVIGNCVLQPYADCPGENLSNRNLSGVDIQGAFLDGANLSGDYLVGAEMSHDELTGANLFKAVLGKANLEGSDLEEARMQWGDLSFANLSRSYAGESDFEHADLYHANLSYSNFIDTNFAYSELEGAMTEGSVGLGGCSEALSELQC